MNNPINIQFSCLNHWLWGGVPKTGLLLLMKDGMTDTIGLSGDDYALLSTYWQGVFFTDADTPITHTFSEWSAILIADANINTGSALALEGSTVFLVYQDGTDEAILTKGLAYVQRHVVIVPEATYWQRVDGSDILRTDESKIEVFP